MPTGYPLKAGTLRIDVGNNNHIQIKCVKHPEFGTRWVQRSHFVWWKYRKQRVPKGWLLHHKDENPTNDRLSNLQLMLWGEHSAHHMMGNKHLLGHHHECTEETREKLRKGSTGNTYSRGTRRSP